MTAARPGLTQELDRAAVAIGEVDRLALACHVTPDGDALGSMLGLYHLAKAAGVATVMAWPEPFATARRYRRLPGLDAAVPSSEFPADPACVLTFDCGSLNRLNELATSATYARANGQLVVVDHHTTNEYFGSINLIDVHAAATAVVVRDLARRMGWPLTRDAAWCLYVALVADTGRFQYTSTNASVFALAEELTAFDLPISEISRELSEEHRFAYLQLAAKALGRAELDETRCFVSTYVSQEDLKEFGVSYEETEGLIDWIRTTAEAEVACVCKEAPDGVRVSLRSLSKVDVGAIAVKFGGGGHRLAAGFTANASVTDVVDKVRSLLPVVR